VVIPALLLLVMTLIPRSVVAQASPVATSGPQFTPLLPAVLAPPRWFRGADEQIHLVYELVLTNAFPVTVDLTELVVFNADDGTLVTSLSGTSLSAITSLLSSLNELTTSLSPGTVGVVWLDVPLPEEGDLPTHIAHRLTVHVPPGLPLPETIIETSGPVEVDRRPPVVLGPPLVGARWVAVGSCCDGPHRRAVQAIDGQLHLAQRFAIDFNQLDADNRLFAGDRTLNPSYPGYGQPVLAVADATVVASVDRYPDQIPEAPTGVTLENAEGNHVILDLGDGRYALYAHLKPGSITVEAGERVRQGQVLGELGNSGSSTGPHLHFHVMDAPSGLVADGLPYGFSNFDLTGQIPPLDEAISLLEAGKALPIAVQRVRPRHDALPLGRDVVTFPETGQVGLEEERRDNNWGR
jgi:hypothetical protein